MKLLIIRHGDAGEADPAQYPDDRVRPLTAEGTKKFREAARRLRELVPQVEALLSSSYVRAWQTAQLLHEEAGWLTPEKFLPLESFGGAAQVLKALAPYAKKETVALVGHEPTQSELVSLLIGAAQIEMKKGSIACVELGSLHAGAGVLKWLITVKALRA